MTSYAYNEAGLVSAMKSGVLDKTTSYVYDDAGRIASATTEGHVNQFSWHPNDSLAGAKTLVGGSTKAEFTYGYDNNGDITKQSATGAETYEHAYGYNANRNLTSWNTDALDNATMATTYSWDKNNNRTKATSTVTANGVSAPSSTTEWSYRMDNSVAEIDAPNRDYDYDYDKAGRLTDDGCTTYTYDHFDRTKTADTSGSTACGDDERVVTYAYDGLDRQRTAAIDGDNDFTTRSIYDGFTTSLTGQSNASAGGGSSSPNVLYQLDAARQAMGMHQTEVDPDRSFLDSDGQGNVTTQVTTGGTVVCAAIYDPFGGSFDPDPDNDVCASGQELEKTGNALWYRSGTRDASTGNYQLGTRTYDPGTGTFTTPDTYRIADPQTDLSVSVDPLTANTYSYVNGNPVNMADPTGHDPAGPCSKYDNRRCGTGTKYGPTRAEAKRAWDRADEIVQNNRNIKSVDSGSWLGNAGRAIWNHKREIGAVAAGIAVGIGVGACVVATVGICGAVVVGGGALGAAVVAGGLGGAAGAATTYALGTDDPTWGGAGKAALTGGALGALTGGVGAKAAPYIKSGAQRLLGSSGGSRAPPSVAASSGGSTFYTVQSAEDAARLGAGGTPWPTSATRAEFGPGAYAWDNADDAANYAAKLQSKACVQVCKFSLDTSKLRHVDVDSLADPDAFMSKYSQLWEGTPNHGLDYITRGTQYGTQHYFSPDAFRSATWIGPQ